MYLQKMKGFATGQKNNLMDTHLHAPNNPTSSPTQSTPFAPPLAAFICKLGI